MLIGAVQVPVTGSIFLGAALDAADEPGAAADDAGAAALPAGLADPAGADAAAEPAGAAVEPAGAAALTAGAAELAVVWFTLAAQALVMISATAVSPMPNR